MSEASSRGSSSSHGGGAGYDGLGSPVPYRIGPQSYQPAVYCKCKNPVKANRWISWSFGQPGRRYLRCKHAKLSTNLNPSPVAMSNGDCGFFRWVDEECSEWYKEVLGDLRDAVWDLKKQLWKKEDEVKAKDSMLVAKQMELEEKVEFEVKQEVVNAKQQEVIALHEMLDGKQHEVEAKELKLQAMKAELKNKNQCIDILVILCLVLVIGLVFMLMNSK